MIISFTFSQLSHPLALGFILLIQTFFSCILINLNHESSWFSYILFLVFLGAILILFIYVTSVASNEKFKFSFILAFSIFIIICVALFISLLYNNYFELFNLAFNLELNNIESLNFKENSLSIIKFYNFPTNILTIILINYLLFSLIVIVKITNFNYGPLRLIK